MRFLPYLASMACALLSPTPVLAQAMPLPPPAAVPPPPTLFATRADIAAAMARAASAIKPGQTVASQPVLIFGTYRASLEYRIGPAGAAVHQGQNEMFQVIEGSGTLILGGTLEKTPSGATINGGTAHRVAAGDVFVVEAGTPHGFNQVDGHLVLLTIKLPAP